MNSKIVRNFKMFVVCTLLIVCFSFGLVGCNNTQSEASAESASAVDGDKQEVQVLGEGQTKFLFTVVDKEGNETNFEINTDETIVGEALEELGLIEGEESELGLYVKAVNGITADYEVDQTYWAFYVNGEYGSTGVDTTKIEEGSTYMFKVEK